MTVKLKPCPFCGSSDIRAEYNEVSGNYDVQCNLCGAWPFHGRRSEVATRWNTRTAVTDEQFAVAVHDGRMWKVVDE